MNIQVLEVPLPIKTLASGGSIIFGKLKHPYADHHSNTYRIRPNYRPCPHNPPPDFLLYIFTYHRPLDDLFHDFLLYFHLLSPT